MKERVYLYDTTLRDGQQTQGVQFSTREKQQIAGALDRLGVDYVEGGWPGANPTDSEFFEVPPAMSAVLTAFGMTKRAGRSAENDDVLAAVLNAGTQAVCLVGKSHDFHVTCALGISLEENVENIRASIAHIVSLGREALFDAEHFFDGYEANPTYALECVKAAYEAGARWVVLCDTNGGAQPSRIADVVRDVIAAGIPGDHLGIHCHNDTEQAVAGSLAALEAGARQIQGTLNGLGERCGNANLTTLIPTLLLKEPYASKYDTGVSFAALEGMVKVSRMLDDILNRVPQRQAPYVGASAFAHKAGLHASAILKDPSTYEHIDPGAVGNSRIIPMSNQAGQSNLRRRLADAGLEVAAGDPALGRILDTVKEREAEGYSYDGAQASFELLAREELGLRPRFFEVKRYRVSIERRKNKYNKMVSLSEAVVVVKVGGEKKLSVSESVDENGTDRGPVNALSKALAKDLGQYQDMIDDMRLVDFKVRITQGGTEAVTRVIIDSEDGKGRRWSTVGVSANIVDASFEALLDAIAWKLLRDGGGACGMTVNACARIVKDGDPDRFMAAMAAPVEARRVLFPLYALNIEVSRAPWLTQESMIAEMRLQWWRDVLTEIREGGVVRRHEVVDAVAEVLDAEGATALDGLVELRRWDIYKEPFEDEAHFWSYLDETAGNLMWISARALGAKDEAAIRAFGRMHGLANWFLAVPELEARGRMPLPDGRPEAVAALARTVLEGVRGLRFEKAAQPALLAGWQARSLLMQVVDHPARVAAGALGLSPIGKRLRLIKQSVFGE